MTGIALGLFFPETFTPVSNRALLILSAVMVLVFLTIDIKAAMENIRKFHNIAAVLLITKGLLPFLLYLAAKPLGSDVSMAVLLLGLTPFAAVSPTLCRLLGGDTEFILLNQIIQTLLAPLYMPFMLLLIAGADIDFNVMHMVRILVFLILIPFGISLVVRPLFRKAVNRTRKYYSAVTILLISLLLSGLLTDASGPVLADPLRALPFTGISFLLSAILCAGGYFLFFFMDKRKRIGVSVASLYMNIGLTAVIAGQFFGPGVLLFILIYELPANLMPPLLRTAVFRRPDSR